MERKLAKSGLRTFLIKQLDTEYVITPSGERNYITIDCEDKVNLKNAVLVWDKSIKKNDEQFRIYRISEK